MEQYSQQIRPEATEASVPEEIHPIAAAFGGDIGEALQKGGQEVASRIESLSLHLARMNYYRGEAQKADIADNYKQALHAQIHGDPNDPNATVTYTPDANTKYISLTQGQLSDISNTAPVQNPIERPLGIFNWRGNMAHGSLDYLDQWHHQAEVQAAQQAKGLGLKNLASLQRDLHNTWISQRDMVSDHEAKQTNDAQIQSFTKGMTLDAESAVTAQTPIALGKLLDSISERNNTLQSSQYDDNDPRKSIMSELTLNEYHTKAIDNAMTANLRTNGGNSTQFQSTLDKLHDAGKINDTVYTNAKDHMDKLSTSISRENERAVKVSEVNSNLNYLNQAMKGKVDFTNPSTIADISTNNPEAGEALSNYALNKDVEVNEKDAPFANAAKTVSELKSQEDYAKFALGEMKKYPQGISQERLNILFNYGLKKADSLKQLNNDPDKPTNPFQNLYDAGMKVLFQTNAMEKHPNAQTLIDYMKAVKEGKSVPDAIQHAQGQEGVRENPHLLNIPPNGMIFHDKNGIKRIVYPDLHTEAIGGGKSPKEDNGDSAT